MSNYSKAWNESYQNRDNHIFYPKEDVVKFLSRFIRKRIGLREFKDVIDFSKTIRALDFGCGIGRNTILFQEFGLEAYGVDLSTKAIEIAKELAVFHGFPDLTSRFLVSNGESIPFVNDFFDIAISEAALDSMTFELAQKNLWEIARVTKKYVFISLIYWNDSVKSKTGEEIVQIDLEKGTIQSYYNEEKISRLLQGMPFSIKQWYLQKESSKECAYEKGRYYLILEKMGASGIS